MKARASSAAGTCSCTPMTSQARAELEAGLEPVIAALLAGQPVPATTITTSDGYRYDLMAPQAAPPPGFTPLFSRLPGE